MIIHPYSITNYLSGTNPYNSQCLNLTLYSLAFSLCTTRFKIQKFYMVLALH